MDNKNVDLKSQNFSIFPKGLVHGFYSNFGNSVLFSSSKKKKIAQKKLFCKLVDRKLPILDYINKELRKFKVLYFF